MKLKHRQKPSKRRYTIEQILKAAAKAAGTIYRPQGIQ